MTEDIITNQKAQIFLIYCIGSSLSFLIVSIINKNTTGIIVNITTDLNNKNPAINTNMIAIKAIKSLYGQNINTE